LEHVDYAWNDLDARWDQPLPAAARFLRISARREQLSTQQATSAPGVATVIELSTPEAELLLPLPLAAILAALPAPRLAAVSVVQPVTGTTLLESLMAARNTAVALCPADRSPAAVEGDWPALSPQPQPAISGWRKRLITTIVQNCPAGQRVPRLALEAGFLQLHDDLNGSHQCSQAIEGEGRHRPGDYWHAIMHRREPDASNAKYWFRHVGEHPIFADLLLDAAGCASSHPPGEFRRWAAEQAAKSTWDPYAFVDVCSRAECAGDHEFRQSCERFQYLEMLRLLVWTWQFAMAGPEANSGPC